VCPRASSLKSGWSKSRKDFGERLFKLGHFGGLMFAFVREIIVSWGPRGDGTRGGEVDGLGRGDRPFRQIETKSKCFRWAENVPR
jgi:hypothetical protein